MKNITKSVRQAIKAPAKKTVPTHVNIQRPRILGFNIVQEISGPDVLSFLEYGLNRPPVWVKTVSMGAGPATMLRDLETIKIYTYAQDEGPHHLTRGVVHRGLTAMAKAFPAEFGKLYGAMVQKKTCDILLQMCLFGRIKYG